MENKNKNNFEQFKGEFKHFVKNTVDNLKTDQNEQGNKKQAQDNKTSAQDKKTSDTVNEELNLTKLFIGSLIILVGIVFLLANFNIITIDINTFLPELFKLWPVLIILTGISVLNKKHIVSSIIGIFIITFIMLILTQIFFVYKNFDVRQINEHTFKIERKINGNSYGWEFFNIEIPSEQQF